MSPDNWNDLSIFTDIKRDLVELIANIKNDDLFTAEMAAEKAISILEKVDEQEGDLLRPFLEKRSDKKQNRPNAVTLASTR